MSFRNSFRNARASRGPVIWRFAVAFAVLGLLSAACGGDDAAEPAPTTVEAGETGEIGETGDTGDTGDTGADMSSDDPAETGAEVVDEEEFLDPSGITAAFVLVGPVGDAGWNWAHDQGRQYAEEQTGAKTLYVENVAETSEAFTSVAIDFIENEDADVIFGTSFGYMEAMAALAEEYPEIVFEHASGYMMNDHNFGNYFGRVYQPRYLSGLAAGSFTETNNIGYVAAFPIPEVIRGINAFTLGARETNPDAQVHVIWTFTWFDPAVEGDAAAALLESGADVIAMHQDSPATGIAAQDAGARWIAYNSDMREFAPDAFLTAPTWDWGPRYAAVIDAVARGVYEPDAYWGGMAEGIVGLALPGKDVPDSLVETIDEAGNRIVQGEWDVFTGEIRDQDGEVRVAAGESLDDGAMLSMDWFVEGVVGSPAP